LVQKDGSGTTIAAYSYTYDANGKLTAQTDHGVTSDFTAWFKTGHIRVTERRYGVKSAQRERSR
jgi:YD repeat-containing protein